MAIDGHVPGGMPIGASSSDADETGGELAQRLLVANQQQLRLICFAVSFKLAIASFSGRLLTKLVNNRNVDRGAVNARVSSRKETEESADIHNSILHIWSTQWNAPKVEQ